MLSLQDIDNIVLNGGMVTDMTGKKIGSVEQVFTSGDSGVPVFVTVRTGPFGMSESFAPLSGASLEESVIKVAFTKDTVKNGPRIDSDRGAITETQEQELYSYYGINTGAFTEESSMGSGQDDSAAAAGDTMPIRTTTDAIGDEGRNEAAGLLAAGQRPPHPLPHVGPPPHLHKHVPVPAAPHPGPHPGPHPPHPPHHGPGEPGLPQ